MFQHTLDRADRITLPEQKVTVIGRTHQIEARAQLSAGKAGKLIVQPANRDTAAGIFLALTHVLAEDPQATVLVYPSDHFIYPEEQFSEVVRKAAQAAQHLRDSLCLLGVLPDRLEPEYGWIHPGPCVSCVGGLEIRATEAFREKPGVEMCRTAMASGALWNTLVMAARAATLWEMGWQCFPEMMMLFEWYREAIGTSEEAQVLEKIYAAMPSRNFSSELLERLPGRVTVMELGGVLWSDWGRPERILETIQRIGKEPAFSCAHAAAV